MKGLTAVSLGAWAAAFAIFASNVATLTLAVAPTAPKTELETLPLGLALVMQGHARAECITVNSLKCCRVRCGHRSTSDKSQQLTCGRWIRRCAPFGNSCAFNLLQQRCATSVASTCPSSKNGPLVTSATVYPMPRYIMGAAIGLVSCGALALGCWLLDFNLQCLGAALMGRDLTRKVV